MKKTTKRETFIIIMPAYNEERYIENTINSWVPIIQMYPGSEMLIINDGSTDNTSDILKKMTKKYNFLHTITKTNEGHGKTVHLGYRKAIKTRHNWIFQTDSDGHFNPKDFQKLWVKRKNSNFILGFRKNRKDKKYRILLTNLISLWIFVLFGKYIKDPNIPFRLINRIYLKNLLQLLPKNSFAPNIFLSIFAAKRGTQLYHIEVEHKKRTKDDFKSKINIIKGASLGFYELLLLAFSDI